MAVANSVMGAKAGGITSTQRSRALASAPATSDFYNLIHTARDIFSLNITGSEAFHVQTRIAETLSFSGI
jgi:hypothetical protein